MLNGTEGKYIYRFFAAAFLLSVSSCMFLFVWIRFVSGHNQTGALMGLGNIGMALGIYMFVYVVLGRMVRAFNIGVERKASIMAAQIITLLLTDILEVFLSMAITGQFRFAWQFSWRYALLWVSQSVVISLLTILFVNIYRKIFPPLQILEVYGDHENGFSEKIDSVFYKYHIKERKHFTQGPFEEAIPKYDAVLVNDIPAEERNDILKLCYAIDKRVYFVPKLSDIISKSSDNLNLFDTPLYLCRNLGPSKITLAIKRVFDIFASLLA